MSIEFETTMRFHKGKDGGAVKPADTPKKPPSKSKAEQALLSVASEATKPAEKPKPVEKPRVTSISVVSTRSDGSGYSELKRASPPHQLSELELIHTACNGQEESGRTEGWSVPDDWNKVPL